MFPTPRTDLTPNTADFERLPFIKPTGFREYDARWLFPEEINLMGMQAIGLGLATLMRRAGVPARIVTGHDFRSYSASIKEALMMGMLAGGAEVFDIGLALSPMAYFAQFELKVEGVAMVTASHNDNGWTGIKMGLSRPLTFGPDEMIAFKEIVLGGEFEMPGGGRYHFVADLAGPLYGRPDQSPEAEPQAEGGLPPAATAPPALLPRKCWRRSAARSSACIASWTTASRTTIPTPKPWRCCTTSARR